jgi:outer membrane lipoprotein-sorting protein
MASGNNHESKMYLVDIRMQPGDLSQQMSAMRVWLDERRFEPSTFSCRDTDHGMLVSVEFKIPREAAAFAERFDGQANRPWGANLNQELARSPFGVVG